VGVKIAFRRSGSSKSQYGNLGLKHGPIQRPRHLMLTFRYTGPFPEEDRLLSAEQARSRNRAVQLKEKTIFTGIVPTNF
jgi:hypothetical protein